MDCSSRVRARDQSIRAACAQEAVVVDLREPVHFNPSASSVQSQDCPPHDAPMLRVDEQMVAQRSLSEWSASSPQRVVGIDMQQLQLSRDFVSWSGSDSSSEELSWRAEDQQQQQQQRQQRLGLCSSLTPPRESLGDMSVIEAFINEWSDNPDGEDDSSVLGDARAVGQILQTPDPKSTLIDSMSFGGGGGGEYPARSSGTADGTSSAKKTYINTRERRRLEIIVLRKQAQELEARLAQLQEGQTTSSSRIVVAAPKEGWTETLTSARSAAAVSASLEPLLWKKLAERQRERLRLSQKENSRLRELVVDQKRLSKSLHRVLLKRAKQVSIMESRLLVPPEWSDSGYPADDELVFGMLLLHSQGMYFETDAVMHRLARQVKTPPLCGKFRKWEVKPSRAGDNNSVFLEMVDCEEVPFARSLVNEAIQRLFKLRSSTHKQQDDQDTDVARAMDTLQISYRSLNGSSLSRMRYVIRNFVEPDRCVFVHDTVIDPITSAGLPMPGLILQERKWLVLTDASSPTGPATLGSASSLGSTSTRIQTYASIAPAVLRSPFSKAWNREVIERAVIPAWDLGVTATTQRLENLLLGPV